MTGSLSHLRVIETGHIISGPFCGHLFADHGAEVVKVEPPGKGDSMRQWGGLYRGIGLYWPIIARNKKSVTLDLRQAEGQAAFLALARTADVVIENFRPGTFERWNIGWDVLHELNPDLILVRITGYGQTGPYRDRAGFGAIGEAMSGFRHLSGEPGRAPVRVGISIGDALAGTQGFVGALLALLAKGGRANGHRGQVVDVALYESMWMYMEAIGPEYQKLGIVRQPSGSTLPGIAPSNVYPTSDEQWVVIGANQDSVFARLASALGKPEWSEPSSEYATHVGRGKHQEQLDGGIAELTRSIPSPMLLSILEAAGVPAGLIYTAADILKDPHVASRGMVLEVAEPGLDGEGVVMPGVVPKLSGTPGIVKRGGPLLGEHNAEIWNEVLGADRFRELTASGVV